MTLWGIAAQVLLWMLAAMGLTLALRAILDARLWPTSVTVAVTVKTKQDADDLDILLCEASRHICRRGVSVAVLISSHLMQGEIGNGGELYAAYQAVIAAYSAEVYMISETNQPPSA